MKFNRVRFVNLWRQGIPQAGYWIIGIGVNAWGGDNTVIEYYVEFIGFQIKLQFREKECSHDKK